MQTVLIVEDDPAIAELVQGLLEDEGYTVLTASDGVVALGVLREQRCNLIIADLMMPNLDGRSLRAAVAATPSFRGIPIVLMTAASHVTEDDRRQFAAVLQKPFHLDELLELTASLLSPSPYPS
ncbi:MAG: hypothetical protein RLZZ387_3096 [Chloroflexota bacterium]|jgi:CheY-like chemotaxis protein